MSSGFSVLKFLNSVIDIAENNNELLIKNEGMVDMAYILGEISIDEKNGLYKMIESRRSKKAE